MSEETGISTGLSILLHNLLEIQAAATPERIALEFHPGVILTYRELNASSNRLARYLLSHRNSKNEIVAIHHEKDHLFVIAILAVLKAGMAWLPLPMNAPPARIKQILDACDVQFVLCATSGRAIIGDSHRCMNLDDILASHDLQSNADGNLGDIQRTPNDLCHILFTSGSTGVPKGVCLEHAAVAHNVQALLKAFGLTSNTRTLQFAAPTFDIFGLDVFMTLAIGGTLVMASLSTIVDNISAFMATTKITYTQLTPTVMRLIEPNEVPSLRTLASSGEALSQELASHWRHRVRLFNCYGPSETIVCTMQELSGNEIDAVCIGLAVNGLEVLLLADNSLEPVCDGDEGEICVVGPQLFRSYLSTESSKKLILDCFVKGKRCYRTGDLGRLEMSGCEMTIRYLGRRDTQVKINGIRLDLGEVEEAILGCVEIEDCVAILPRKGPSIGRLCSVIVLDKKHQSLSGLTLSSPSNSKGGFGVLYPDPKIYLILEGAKIVAAAKLPVHALPTTWWPARNLPLTQSGKTDRKALRSWLENMEHTEFLNHVERFSSMDGHDNDHPHGMPEAQGKDMAAVTLLRSLWANVLKRPTETIGIDVPFVALGANSLDVIRLVTCAKKAGLSFSITDVYLTRTINQLSRNVDMARKPRQEAESPSLGYRPFSQIPRERPLARFLQIAAATCQLQVEELEDLYPCTPYQSGLMALELRNPGSYICAFSWTLAVDTDIHRFRNAWDNLIASESVLRNRLIYDVDTESFWQVTTRHQCNSWTETAFSNRMACGDDLCRGLLTWMEEAKRWKFSLKIHHSIVDGWSLRLLLNRLESNYLSTAVQEQIGLPYPEFIQYYLEENVRRGAASEAFWRQYLNGYTSTHFPRVPAQSVHDVHATGRHSTSLALNLAEIAQRYDVTAATLLYAAVTLVLGLHSNTDDVTYGVILAGRDLPIDGIFQTIGPAFCLFPFRMPVSRLELLTDMLKRTEKQLIDILPSQRVGMQRIKNCGPGAATACNFQTIVIVQPEDEDLAGASLWEKVHGQTQGLADSIPLSLELILADNKIGINCNHDPTYIASEEVKLLLDQLAWALKSLSHLGPMDAVQKIDYGEKDGHIAKFLPTESKPQLCVTASNETDLNRLAHRFHDRPRAVADALSTSSFGIKAAENGSEKYPVTAIEVGLEAAYRHIFQHSKQLTTNVDFFKQGGDSLAAIRLVNAARERGIEISIRDIYSHPRLEDLAVVAQLSRPPTIETLEAKDSPASQVDASPAVRRDILEQCQFPPGQVEDIYPASPFQEGLAAITLMDQISGLDDGNGMYFAKMTYLLAKNTDVALLRQVLLKVVSHFPIFRTILVNSSSGVMQVVLRRNFSGTEASRDKGSLFWYDVVAGDQTDELHLVLHLHHALYDAWTLEKFFAVTTQYYQNPGASQKLPLPYKKFIEYLSAQNHRDAVVYWQTQLRDVVATPFPRFPSVTYQPRATKVLKCTSYVDLKKIRKCGFSAATVIATSLALVLSTYCNSEVVCFGTVLSGRDDLRIQEVAGPTISIVPLRVKLTSTQELSIVLKEVQESLLGMQQHQHCTAPNEGSRITSQLRTLLVIQQSLQSRSKHPHHALFRDLIPDKTSMNINYALTVVAEASPSGTIVLEVRYDPLCLPETQATRLIKHIGHVMAQFSEPSRLISDIQVITSADHKQICLWNPKFAVAPAHILHMFEKVVCSHPNSVAIEYQLSDNERLQSISYAELDSLAAVLATEIGTRCAQKAVVGLCLKNSPLLTIAIFAVWKAGRAFVAIDPSSPRARQLAILADVGDGTLVLTEPFQAQLLVSPRIITLHRYLNSILIGYTCEGVANLGPKDDIFNSDTAYIFYTSGTSGSPKGVVISHDAIATSMSYAAHELNLNSTSRMLQFCSCIFDAILLEIFATLITGGVLCIPSESQRVTGAFTVQYFRISHLILTPTVAQLIEPLEVPTVQSLFLGGEAPSVQLIQNWATQRPTTKLYNGYGPTENSVVTSINAALSADQPRNIGVATGCNCFITVVGDLNTLAAVGAVGELVILGHTLSEGYLNQPELTSKSFGRGLRWMSQMGWEDSRYYRTGDLVRYEADGSIHYLGRNDSQVKVRGQRLEPAEIEHHITKYGKFLACVVDVVTSDTLVAFLQVRSSQSHVYEQPLPPKSIAPEALDKLQQYLRLTLPDFMVPSIYVPVANWPITGTGKIDRRHLLSTVKLDSYRTQNTTTRVALADPSHVLLATTCANVLGISESIIGKDDSIYSLGGDSITTIRIIAQLRKHRWTVDPTQISHHVTLQAMAGSMKNLQKHNARILTAPNPFSLLKESEKDDCLAMARMKCGAKMQIQDVLPCTGTQETMMITSTKFPGTFLDQEIMLLKPSTSVAKLVATLQRVWARHEILRTCIILDDTDRSLQVVFAEDLQVKRVREKDLSEFLRRDATFHFGYGQPLSRCALLCCGSESYLIISQHHAVFDAWSMDLLWKAIEDEYFLKTEDIVPFTKFSSFVSSTLEVQRSPEAEQFWRNHLAGLRPYSLPQIQSMGGFETNQKHASDVLLPYSSEIPLAIAAEAAWGLLLSRYVNSEDISFGIVRSGRTEAVENIDRVLGPTLATIPRRIRPAKNMSVDKYLEVVTLNSREVAPYEQFGVQNIRKLSEEAREVCTFSSILVVQMARLNNDTDSESIFQQYAHQDEITYTSDCLIVECQPMEHGLLRVSISYDDRMVSKDEIRWCSYHFGRLLSEVMTKKEVLLHELEMTGPDTIAQIHEWNGNVIEDCRTEVHKIVSQRSLRWKTVTAIEATDANLTYEELENLSSSLAGKLAQIGIGAGHVIPILYPRGAMMVVAVLAVLKTGAAWLAFDTANERLNLILNVLLNPFVLCSSQFVTVLNSLQIRSLPCDLEMITLDQALSISGDPKFVPPKVFIKEESNSPAYIIFTSGTSGVPKGVIVEHNALAITVFEHARRLKYAKGTRTLLFSAQTFDTIVLDIFLTLFHGGCLIIPNEQQRLGTLSDYINDKKIDMVGLTSTAVRNLLPHGPSEVPSVKILRVAGEPMTKAIINEWSAHVQLVNSYGPAECAVEVCMNENITVHTDPRNIGYPEASHLWVVEPNNPSRLAPIGAQGELLVSGLTLARGYLNDEERTQQVFLDGSSFSWALPGENRFYATGDLVRQNANGSLMFLGRKDLQMKFNGNRIEPQEIESVLELCEGVQTAIVDKMMIDENGSELLVGFFTIEPELTFPLRTSTRDQLWDNQTLLLTPTDLSRSITAVIQSRLTNCLPSYMIPQLYIPIQTIPLTTNGKVNRGALRIEFGRCSGEQFASYKIDGSAKRLPKTTIQKILQALWAQVLSLDPTNIGLDSEFVRLGGESLAAIKLARMFQELGLELPIVDILRNPRMEDMARVISTLQTTRTKALAGNIQSITPSVTHVLKPNKYFLEISQVAKACCLSESEIKDIYPTSPLQESLLVASSRVPGSYTSREVVEIPPTIDLERFKRALEFVLEANPILRTRICLITTENSTESVQVVCHTRIETSENSDEITKHSLFDFGTPLVHITILISGGRRKLQLTKHHSVYDGFSSQLLWKDLEYSYVHLSSPPLRPSYRKYVEYFQELEITKSVAFWKVCLQDFESGHYPSEPRSDSIGDSNSSQTLHVNTKLNDSSRFTFSTLARAAWALVMSLRGRSCARVKDVCFLTTLSGRSTSFPGIENLMGPTITTIPVRTIIDSTQIITDYLSVVQEQSISELLHVHLGYSKIREVSKCAGEACKSSNLLIVQPTELEKYDLPLGLTSLHDQQDEFRHGMGIVMECSQEQVKKSISFRATCDVAQVSQSEMNHLLQQFSRTITLLIDPLNEQLPVQSLIDNLGDQDLQLTIDWNKSSSLTSTTTLHELVAKSAKNNPSSLAVHSHDGKLSYGELLAAANSLAIKLKHDHDLKPGDLIPLCFEKSCGMIVAVLGILIAGAGFLSLDPAHPKSRSDYIISDVKAKVVVISPLQSLSTSFAVPTLVLGTDFFMEILLNPSSTIRQHANSDCAAYAIYTSGTTGAPKAVVTDHNAASISFLEFGRKCKLDLCHGKFRTLQYSSGTFDASVLEIFVTLIYGGVLCVPLEEDRTSSLEEYMMETKISFAVLTPTVASLLDPRLLPTMKVMVLCGELASHALLKRWTSPDSKLTTFLNGYGPTEAAVCCAAGEIDPNSPGHVGKRTVGSLWIVDQDDHDRVVPISCVGELVISGPTIARGYLNNEIRSKQAFIEDVAWLARAGSKRFYKTGDLARFDLSGNVEIIGRKNDQQVKLNGIRIEIGEIESAISTCPSFSDVEHIAVAKGNITGKDTLIVFSNFDGKTIRSSGVSGGVLGLPSPEYSTKVLTTETALLTTIPRHLIPGLWIPVANWPLNSSGKTDRSRLVTTCESLSPDMILAYQRSDVRLGMSVVKSLSVTEIKISEVWKQVLQKNSKTILQPEDDFFRLGGDSLRTIMLVSALRSVDICITAQQVFQLKSLRQIANLVDENKSSQDDQHGSGESSTSEQFSLISADADSGAAEFRSEGDFLSPKYANSSLISSYNPDTMIPPPNPQILTSIAYGAGNIEDIFPASFTQTIFLIEAQKYCRVYYSWCFFEIDPSNSIAETQTACKSVSQLHPILRTSFHMYERTCYQAIHRTACNFKPLFSTLSPEDICAKLEEDVDEPVKFGDVLTKFRLLIGGESSKAILAVGLSHAMYDGYCKQKIVDELFLAFTAAAPTVRVSSTHRSYIEHTLRLNTPDTDSFWQNALKTATITSITRNLPLATLNQHILRTLPFSFKHMGVLTYPAMLQAAWAIVLGFMSNTSDITFGHLVSGRYAAFDGILDVVGPCLNFLPLRIIVDPLQTVQSLLLQIAEAQVATIPYECTPLDRISRAVGWAPSTKFKTILQYQNIPKATESGQQTKAANNWREVGGAVYNGKSGVLVPDGECWMLAFPPTEGENSQATFSFSFSTVTMTHSRAEGVIDLFYAILNLMNDNIDAEVSSIMSLPLGKTLSESEQLSPPPATIYPSSSEGLVAPAGLVSHLKTIWLQVLQFLHNDPLDDTMLDDSQSFFDLGGDSISAAEVTQICRKGGLELSLQDLLDFPTVREQALLVAGMIERPKREEVKLKYVENWDFA